MLHDVAHDAAYDVAHDAMRQVGRRGEEMSTLRAQSITWASENKARRAEVGSLRRELDELKREHGAVVSSATMWEERSNKLQDELKLKAEPCAQRGSCSHSPCGHPLLQRPTRFLRAATEPEREEPSPLKGKERLRQHSNACSK
jgi:hypothetical protein